MRSRVPRRSPSGWRVSRGSGTCHPAWCAQFEGKTVDLDNPQTLIFALAQTFSACSVVSVTSLAATSPGRLAMISLSLMPILGSVWHADIAHDSSVRCALCGIPAVVRSWSKALLTITGVGECGAEVAGCVTDEQPAAMTRAAQAMTVRARCISVNGTTSTPSCDRRPPDVARSPLNW